MPEETFTFVAKENGKVWIEGIKKRKIPFWTTKVPEGFIGFAKIEGRTITLYNKDWTVNKSYRVTHID